MEVETQANCMELDVEVEGDEQLEALQSAYRQGQLLLQRDVSHLSKTELENAVARLADLTVPFTEQITTTLPEAFAAVHDIVSSFSSSLKDHLPLVLPETLDDLVERHGALSEEDRALLLEQSQVFLVSMAQGAFDVVTQESRGCQHRLGDVFALFVSQLHASTNFDSWEAIHLLHGKLSRMSSTDCARLFTICLHDKPAVYPLVLAPYEEDKYLNVAVTEARRVHQITQRALQDIVGDIGDHVHDLLLAAVLHMSTKRQRKSMPSLPFINDPTNGNEGMDPKVGSASCTTAEQTKPMSPRKSPNKVHDGRYQESPSLASSRKQKATSSDRLDENRSTKRPRRSHFANKYPE